MSVDVNNRIIVICKGILSTDISDGQKEIIFGILRGVLCRVIGEMDDMLSSIDSDLKRRN